MGKHGPCCHCGVTSTPLWRNGPLDKPVLCNACGSRWRTKGTLVNYTPLHARAEGDDYEDPRISKARTISLKKKDEKLKKRKLSYENTSLGKYASDYGDGFQKSLDEDTSNRSSSGSAVSNSESCAQFSADASDLSGPSQSIVWEAQVPSKKRTSMSRPKPSPVEKLTQDLCAILHEQQSSNLSGTSEEELLFESDTPMVSVEIGHGSVLMKHPSFLPREEESEASSLSVENKACVVNEAYSHTAPLFRCKDFNSDSIIKSLSNQMVQQDPIKRDESINDRMVLLWNHNSPLCHVDLNDVINFDVLLGHLTSEEQQQLLKYLPSCDNPQFSGSLRNMFDNSSFKENISSFHQLLSEGFFSDSFSEVEGNEFTTFKMLAMSDLTKAKWLELYKKLKDSKHLVASGAKSSISKNLGSTKRLREDLSLKMAETRTTMRVGSATKKAYPFDVPTKNQHVIPEPPVQFADDGSDQDLLLDLPSNGFFPQAELLPVSSFVSHQ